MSEVTNLFDDVNDEPAAEPDADAAVEQEEQVVEPEGDAAPEGDEAPAKEEPSTVPHAALHEERTRRKELQQEIQNQRELMARMEERFRSIQDRITETTKPAEDPGPSYDEDPAAFLRHQNDALSKRLETIEGEREQQGKAVEQQRQLEAFRQHFEGVEREFSKEHTDYYDAIAHLRHSWATEMEAFGYPPAQIDQILQYNATQMANTAITQGRNPAEVFYNNAKVRGYTPKGESEKKIQQVRSGQQRSKTLGPSGGGSQQVTLAQLADLSDDEFEKATAGKNWQRLWQ